MPYSILLGDQIIQHYTKKISALRSGRVNSSILDTIEVEVYGSKMHVQELATITIPEPHQLMITPFDKSVIPAISKAITESNLGVNPVDDGAGLRLAFPPMTEEVRKQRVKELHKLQEEARIEVRLSRQDKLKAKKKDKEAGLIGENELSSFESSLQKEVDKLNAEIENITKEKEAEIMKV